MRTSRQRVREQEMAKQLQALREDNDRLRNVVDDREELRKEIERLQPAKLYYDYCWELQHDGFEFSNQSPGEFIKGLTDHINQKLKKVAAVTEFRCGTETTYEDGTKEFWWND